MAYRKKSEKLKVLLFLNRLIFFKPLWIECLRGWSLPFNSTKLVIRDRSFEVFGGLGWNDPQPCPLFSLESTSRNSFCSGWLPRLNHHRSGCFAKPATKVPPLPATTDNMRCWAWRGLVRRMRGLCWGRCSAQWARNRWRRQKLWACFDLQSR